MRIGFNIHPLTGGHKDRGTGSYTRSLLDAFHNLGTQNIIEFTDPKTLPPETTIVHYPFFDPFRLTLPWRISFPLVVTVHDLIPLRFSEHFPRGLKGELKWQVQRQALNRASAIITDSWASKKDICSILRFSSEKVHVIYLAPAEHFFTSVLPSQLQSVRDAYSLPAEFMLYVGDVNWNKNIPRLLRAAQIQDVRLVLIGRAFLQDGIPEVREINVLIDELKLHDKITRLGYVPQEDLPALYHLASGVAQVSIAEGFGLPVLEAMACGTSCIVSAQSSLDEIAGPSVRVNPLSVEDIARGFSIVLKQKKTDTRKTNTAWAAQFSWERTARETIGVYEKVIGKGSV